MGWEDFWHWNRPILDLGNASGRNFFYLFINPFWHNLGGKDFFMENKNKILSARGIAEIAILTAIAFGLDFLQGGLWRGVFTNGGSIGLAMIPILLLCYRRGFISGLISGFVLSFLQMLGGVYAISDTWYNVFLQIGLDYIFAYPVVALAGLFFKPFQNANNNKDRIKWIIVGTTIGGVAKFMCHFLAGILFWKNFAFKAGPYVYSLVYNGAYMLPNIIIAAVILIIILLKAPQLLIEEKKGEEIYE